MTTDAAAPQAEWAPDDEAGFVEAVATAHAAGEPLAIGGLGSKAGMLRPVQAARALSSRNHHGITLYSPNEMIISARAGTPVSVLEATLAERGQQLSSETPDYAALLGGDGAGQTIGGVTAANLSGPRRITWGALRDQVMGVRAVNGAGELIHSGGRVLKNVTGLDLCKLLAGSHGTLGVLTEVTVKVMPVAESSATVLLAGLNPDAAVAALSAGLGSPYGVSGAAFLPIAAAVPELAGFGASATLLRLEDFASSVRYRSDRLRTELAAHGRAEILDEAASRALWRAVRDAAPLAPKSGPGEADGVWRVSVRPSAGPGVIRAVTEAMDARWFLDWGGGLVWISAYASAANHAAICAAASAAGGVWTLMRAPAPLRAAVEVVPPEAPPLAALTRRVKAAMDPKGILNPGRLYAGV